MVKIAIFVHIIISCLIMIGGYEAILGFRQLYGFSVSNHSLYAYTDPSLRMTRGKGMTRIMGMTRYLVGAVGLMILCLLPSG